MENETFEGQPLAQAGLLSTKDAARYLNVPVRTLEYWRQKRRGGPPFYRLPKNCVYAMSDLAAFLAAHRVEPRSE